MPQQGTVSPEGSTIGERTEPLGDKLAREYRAYTVGSDGRFIGFEPLVCADDPEAIQKASFNAKVRLGLRKFERTFSLLNDLTKTGSGVMDQTRQELEQKPRNIGSWRGRSQTN